MMAHSKPRGTNTRSDDKAGRFRTALADSTTCTFFLYPCTIYGPRKRKTATKERPHYTP